MKTAVAGVTLILLSALLCGCPPGRPTESGRGGGSSNDVDRLRMERDTLRTENARLRTALLGTSLWENTLQTSREGGLGGLPFLRMCPQGYGLVGLRGRGGSLIDAIYPVCGSIADGPNIPRGFSSQIPLDVVGGSGGTGYERLCPEGTHVTGARGRVSGDFVRGVSLFCGIIAEQQADVENQGSTSRGSGGLPPIGDASEGRSFRHSCPDGYVAVGISGQAGAYVDSLAFVCGQVTQTTESLESDQNERGENLD